MIDILQGTWHLISSNFNKWKKESIHQVTFNYTPTNKEGSGALLDEVRYLDGTKTKVIRGYDFPDDDTRFTWRGKGLLFVLVSKWQIEWMHPDKNCMILSFEKTLLTSAGVDIIARDKKPKAATLQEAKRIIEGNDRLRFLSSGMVSVS